MKTEHASMTTRNGEEGPALQSVYATGRLEGLVLSMTLKQVFRNTTQQDLEVVYTFPLAWGAVLLGLEATLGGQRRLGRVLAKQEATERYEAAVEKGDAPVMVEKVQEGLFSASLGNLKPGEEACIEISYAQLLGFEQGRVRLVIPTTVAPRFGDAVGQGGLQPDQVTASNLLVEYPFSLKLDISGAVAQARISSPTHPITQQAHPAGVGILLNRKAWLDRDFVLLLEGLQGQSFALSGPDPLSGEGHTATLASYCPLLPAEGSAPLRMKMLVDCSGSMGGDSIEQARIALASLTSLLGAGDQFSYSRFGSRTERVLPPLEGSLLGTTRLRLALSRLQADLGGTELGEAIRDTFALDFPAGRGPGEADVLLITDGEVWEAQRIVDEARRSGHRIYALGVGSAPAESLLRELAEATGGACEMVSPNEDMREAVQRLVTRMRCALAVEARLEAPAGTLWSSATPKRLAHGETVHLFLRTSQPLAQAPTLWLNGQALAAPALEASASDLIARLAAARQIAATEEVASARDLAEKYQLVTEHTNLLLTFERDEADKAGGMPQLQQVTHMTPAGWGGTGTVMFSRKAATPSMMYSIRQTAPQYESLSVPTVWRNNRSSASRQVDSLTSGSLDDFEIPAFLRKSTDGPAPALVSNDGGAILSGSDLLRLFNDAATRERTLRKALRVLTDLPQCAELLNMITGVSRLLQGPVNAWACYLMWLHEHAADGESLSAASLALVNKQLAGLSPQLVQAAYEHFTMRAPGTPHQPLWEDAGMNP